MKRCTNCGGEDLSPVTPLSDYRYELSGLGHVVVRNGIKEQRCNTCGETFTRIPGFGPLLRTIAIALTEKQGRLAGAEIRCLRKHIDLAAERLAEVLGVSPATVARWENDEDPIGGTADRMLRLLVRTYDYETGLEDPPDYSWAEFPDKPSSAPIVVFRGRHGWQLADE